MKKKINIKYFAVLREQAQKNEEKLETNSDTVGELYGELALRYGFSLGTSHIRVAINEEFREMTETFSENDSIVFIPPVAGG